MPVPPAPQAQSRLQPLGAVGLRPQEPVSPLSRRRLSWAQPLKAAPCLSSPAPVLASEPAGCDTGKSLKETDDVEKPTTKPGRSAFWARRRTESLENRAEKTNKHPTKSSPAATTPRREGTSGCFDIFIIKLGNFHDKMNKIAPRHSTLVCPCACSFSGLEGPSPHTLCA